VEVESCGKEVEEVVLEEVHLNELILQGSS
jgi:hypothetical protein